MEQVIKWRFAPDAVPGDRQKVLIRIDEDDFAIAEYVADQRSFGYMTLHGLKGIWIEESPVYWAELVWQE